MGLVYSPPKEVGDPPRFDPLHEEKAEKYVDSIKEWAKRNGKGKYAGEEIYFGVADGNARYVVISLKPVKLIHLNVDDGYEFQYAHRLTASDIKDQIESHKKLKALFAK